MTQEEKELEYQHFIVATAYYSLVFIVAEFARRAVDAVFSKSSLIHRFFIEFIGTVTICVCVFENGVVFVNYGISAFFLVSSMLGFLFGALGRGTFGTPMGPVEKFVYGELKLSKLLVLVIAEILGGMFSWRIAMEIWRQSLHYTDTHIAFYSGGLGACELNHKHPFFLMIGFEIFGAFLMRTVIPKVPSKVANWVIPAFIAAIFSFSILYVGDAGLDPVVASSLFFGCRGVSQQWFILQYWLCPIIGWMLAAYIDRSRSKLSTKKEKKATKKSKSQEKQQEKSVKNGKSKQKEE